MIKRPPGDRLNEDGFATVPVLLQPAVVDALLAQLRDLGDGDSPTAAPGIRDLINKCPAIGQLAAAPWVRAMVEPVLGPEARVVRSIYFNKSARTNWQVGWHQDLTIAVKRKAGVDGYTAWSVKEGIAHVQPPAVVLEDMLTLRLHLDDADESNGALWVVPGSHRHGRLTAQAALELAHASVPELCAVSAGGAMLLRPLLLHASRKSRSERPRRVIHLEFCAAALPAPLDWLE